jgi:hypothetical protein
MSGPGIKAMIGGWRPRHCGGALWETTSIVGDKSASQFLENLRDDLACVRLIHCKGLTFLARPEKGRGIMRRYRFSMCFALALAAGLVYSGSQAFAQGSCAVGLNIHPHARILLNHHTIAQCNAAAGCKCVSCTNFNGSVSSLCYPLAAPIPH